MQLRYNYRVYPTPGQREALARAFGCARVVFNDGLRARQEARGQGLAYICDGELSKRVITEAKKTPQREWLAEVSSVVLQQALADLNVAYRNFFNSMSGKRRGRKVAPPRFRSRKDNRQAIRFTANARFKVLDNGRLRLPKIGDVAVRWSRYGRTFARIDRFAPTSQTCSTCGRINGPKPLTIRSWTCPCGAVHDRDVNAAINILAAGRAESLNACGAQVRPARMPAPRREAGIRPGVVRCSAPNAEGISVP